MDIYDLKIGTRLELELIGASSEKAGQIFVSQLIDIISEEDIIISCPIFESKFVFITSGSSVRILFLHEKYGLLSFTAVIRSKEKKGNLLLLHTKLVNNIAKIQRRKYYRLDCYLEAMYRLYPELPPDQQNSPEYVLPEFKKAITKNLSGNGACIVTEESIQKGSALDVQIFLSKDNALRAMCLIMRSLEINTSKEKKYELGLYFKKISARDQDKLIKYIFDQQRVLLKRNS